MPVRVVLADDHPVVLEGLRSILARNAELEVVGAFADGASALEAIDRSDPDVAVLDAAMPGMSGVDVVRRLRERGGATRIVILASTLNSQDLVDAVRLGVDGIVLKDEAAEVLSDCVQSVSWGGQWFSGQLLKRAMRIAGGEEDSGLEELTDRELEVAAMVATGLQNKEIAQRLGIASGTVRIHVHNIFKKLGIQNRVELANRVRGDDRMEGTPST